MESSICVACDYHPRKSKLLSCQIPNQFSEGFCSGELNLSGLYNDKEVTIEHVNTNNEFHIKQDEGVKLVTTQEEFAELCLDGSMQPSVYGQAGDDCLSKKGKCGDSIWKPSSYLIGQLKKVYVWLAKKPQKKVTKYSHFKVMNSDFMNQFVNMDEKPKTESDILQTWLHVEYPANLEIGKRQILPPFDYSDSLLHEEHFGPRYRIQRALSQMYMARFLDRAYHGTFGLIGKEAYDHFRQNGHTKELRNDRDHLANNRNKLQPIVIHTEDILYKDEPIIERSNGLWRQFYGHVYEVLDHISMDGDRKVPMLNIGITNLEAKAWLKANFTDKPGVTTTTRKLSKGLRKWCGEMGCLVSGELKDAVES